ncbi:DUF456 family protein [Pelosinus sp. sgz500959]|uniref:DUF456 family protein n=1 Tax=Pelosinus sp. sgz500959 TaxID=3242472 RepID=UPI003672A244
MLILKFSALFIMFIGLACTLAPRLYGTVIILVVAAGYGIFINLNIFQSWIGFVLLLLTLLSEVGARGLRILTTRPYRVSRRYSIDTSVCNLAGIIIASALLGSFVGATIWEIVVGKTLLARLDMIGKILIRLILTAGVRLICGLLMIIIIVKYMMYTL